MLGRIGCALGLSVVLAAFPALGGDLNKSARDFTIHTYDKQTVSLADLKGEVVVLNYWATWCGPCKAELLVFDNYMRQHPNGDVRVYAIEAERSLPPDYLKKMAAAAHFAIGVRMSGAGYGVIQDAVPTSYVIDRAGILRHAKPGAFNAASFEAVVNPLLAAAPPPANPPAS